MKEVIAMVKIVLSKAGVINVALVVLGWVCFLSSHFVSGIYYVLGLQAIARVLPYVFYFDIYKYHSRCINLT